MHHSNLTILYVTISISPIKYKVKHYLELHADHLSLQKLNIKTKQYVQNTYLVFIIDIYLFAFVDG